MSDPSQHDSDENAGAMARRTESRCGGCGQSATRTRRGLCAACYARWVRARPVGLGASCASCNDRRLEHLRHFELRGLWVVLCHNCCARAERLTPAPRSVDVLLSGIKRQRRSGEDRRDGRAVDLGAIERRRGWGRRAADLAAEADHAAAEAAAAALAAGELAAVAAEEVEAAEEHDASDLVIEMVAEYAQPRELRDPDGEPITAVHAKLDPASL